MGKGWYPGRNHTKKLGFRHRTFHVVLIDINLDFFGGLEHHWKISIYHLIFIDGTCLLWELI